MSAGEGAVEGTGDGPDLVVFEAGLGFSGRYWGPVQEALARLAPQVRTLAYDRAGLGESTPDAQPRDPARLTDDLDHLIDAHPHRRLVLVGHSWGGPIVRLVAARRLARGLPPTGLALIDASDERADLYFGAAATVGDALYTAVLPVLGRLGLLRPVFGALASGLPEPYRTATVAASSTPSAARATAAENRHIQPGLAALRRHPPALPGVPTVVVSGGRAGPLERRSRRQLNEAHAATAAAHDGRHVVTPRSGHLVPITEPDLVAGVVLELLQAGE
ncbi:pimeloyl-ACP methyl ester carboxylesterase [Kineosphaera limosa]|uniref:alpha/beta fold hydrolase n=1 Tax=Kineosphaera limosa TaxID=111564 RepID=UPI000A2F58A6|nr:alpha/beta hydrolase [Kineosphaera limosa]NYE00048.1 pimeloyl-ACP methyl ester carboxylesterase [Kineosphaera limosa]